MTRHVPRVFWPQPLASGQRLRLDADRVHHLVNVLRLREGDPLVLFDGRGGEFEANVTMLARRDVEVELGGHRDAPRESGLVVELAQGISRGERMDYSIQKAVELGVCAIQPLHTERSLARLEAGRHARKQAHWREVARSASEQSGRERVPLVADSLALAQWLQATALPATRLLLDPDGGCGLREIRPQGGICLLAGPEGGLSDTEIGQARAAGFIGVRLGPRVLRTETAGVAALAALQVLWGDLAG
jgi:16S rRNA (uracil1498-N3)-methyltransferase